MNFLLQVRYEPAAKGGDFRPLRPQPNFVGGLGMTALTSGDGHMVVVPIRSGLGLRAQSKCWLSQVHGRPDLKPVLIAEPC
jgi:hypothetical protein